MDNFVGQVFGQFDHRNDNLVYSKIGSQHTVRSKEMSEKIFYFDVAIAQAISTLYMRQVGGASRNNICIQTEKKKRKIENHEAVVSKLQSMHY